MLERHAPKKPDVAKFLKKPTSTTRSEAEAPKPLNFTDRVWFPGEWEEVKAIVVNVRYEYLVEGHEKDSCYRAEQLIKNYGEVNYWAPGDSLPTKMG